jgi:hypothetical protein
MLGRVFAMIKMAFDALNGIEFALPKVQIAGEGETSIAAAGRCRIPRTRIDEARGSVGTTHPGCPEH